MDIGKEVKEVEFEPVVQPVPARPEPVPDLPSEPAQEPVPAGAPSGR